jgi:hypothetical protein
MLQSLDASSLGLNLGGARRSIDNGSLTRSRSSATDNYLAAAATALASGTAVGNLQSVGSGSSAAGSSAGVHNLSSLLSTPAGGSLPSQSYMMSAAAALQGSGLARGGGGGQQPPIDEERSFSLDQ